MPGCFQRGATLTETETGRSGRELSSDIAVWGGMPLHSKIHRVKRLREGLVIIRSHSPEGRTPGGLYVAKNDKWPRIWGWILAIPRETLRRYPLCRPGTMIVYSRFSEELAGEDVSIDPAWCGPELPLSLMEVENIEAVFDPAIVPVQL